MALDIANFFVEFFDPVFGGEVLDFLLPDGPEKEIVVLDVGGLGDLHFLILLNLEINFIYFLIKFTLIFHKVVELFEENFLVDGRKFLWKQQGSGFIQLHDELRVDLLDIVEFLFIFLD